MRSSILFVSVLVVAGVATAAAQLVIAEEEPTGFASVTAAVNPEGGPRWMPSPVSAGDVDVVHYTVVVAPAMNNGFLSGRVSARIRFLSGQDSVRLHAVKLQIDSVRVDGAPAGFRIDSTAEAIAIALGGPRSAGDSATVDIGYRRLPSVPRPGQRQGWYYFHRDSVSPPLPAHLGYTMSEPSDARFWFPCHDDQADKATAEMEVRVPAGYVGASNGRLLGTTVNTDGSVSWFWREDHQIATYLMCVTVSDFAIAEVPYVTARNDTIPLQYYVWHQDSAECAAYLPRVREMMVALGTLFGEYPFDKYGMTAIVPFTFGGMEHQTLTTMNRFDRTNDDVVVHELAHQWWGDLVTCGRWEDIWLNEGFATYAEALWKESTGGAPALRTVMAQKLHLGFGSWLGAPYDPVGQGFNLFADVVYNKGGWVLHMLRGVLGDSTFFHTLRTYRDRYTESTALTGDFRAVAEQVSGRDLGWFFDQWVYGVGWPTYALAWKVEGDTLLATVYQQQRSGWRSAYTMPLQLRALSVGHAATWTVWDSLRTQVFRLPAAFAPESVVLDPEGWVLKENGIAPAGVTEEPIPPAFRLDQNYPNPFNAGTRLRYGLAAGGDVRLSIVDLLGSEVAVLVAGRQEAGAYTIDLPLAGLATGVYFARLHAGGAVFTRKMLLLR